jgi:hypothetical protein
MDQLAVCLVEGGHGRRLTARRSNAVDTLADAAREDDLAVTIPGRPAGERTAIREAADSAAREVESLQLRAGHEAQRAAVGGPERKYRAVGPFEPLRHELVSRAQPDPGSSLGRVGHHRQVPAGG